MIRSTTSFKADQFFSEAYHALLNRVNICESGLGGHTDVTSVHTQSPIGSVSDEPLQPTDFPNINFWSKRNWSRSTNVKGLVRFNYIETKDGVMVNENRLQEMREAARNIWKGFKKRGIFPPTWKSAGVNVRSEYYREMRHKFLEFRLCKMDWKADQLATDSYYSWHNYHDQATAKSKGLRQGANIGSMEPVAKRMKTGAEPGSGEPFTTSLDSYFSPESDFEPSLINFATFESGPGPSTHIWDSEKLGSFHLCITLKKF